MEAVYETLGLLDCCKTKQRRPLAKSSIKSHPTSSMAVNDEHEFYYQSAWQTENYPLNDVVIFGGKQKIIAKRTKMAMFDYDAKNPKNYVLGSRTLASFIKSFSSPESTENTELLPRNFNTMLPENIAISIAKRLKCRIMIDAICGSGDNTIQVK